MKKPSPFFQVLYDGCGTSDERFKSCSRWYNFSIFRSIAMTNNDLTTLTVPSFHDFAVLWDEDDDERVMYAVEKMYASKLLSPALLIAEAEGALEVWISFAISGYQEKIYALAQNLAYDPWASEVSVLPAQINLALKQEIYFAHIVSSWGLGVKPIKESEYPSIQIPTDLPLSGLPGGLFAHNAKK